MTEARGWYSRGYLPHFDSPESIQHIVFRTADSLPRHLQTAGNDDSARRAWTADKALDEGLGACPLQDQSAAEIVENALLHFDGARYHALAWCVMPNHVHVLIEQTVGFSLPEIVRSWKTYTAARINALNGARGPFWARDYFDRFMRDEAHFEQTIAYIETNPVKAGLCSTPEAWPFSSARRRGLEKGRPEAGGTG